MPRLLDDIRAAGRLAMPPSAAWKPDLWEQHTRQIWPLLVERNLPVFLIDNVAEYYFTCEQEYWDLSLHFPNLAPPFPMAWYEHKLPKRIHSRECGDTELGHLAPHGRIGALVLGLTRDQITGEGIPDNLHWALVIELFIDWGRTGCGYVDGSHGTINLAVDSEGRMIGTPWML